MSRITTVRNALPTLESSIQQFVSSAARFKVLRTIGSSQADPKTLFILDSSYNPPSIAHLSLAKNALAQRGLSFQEPFRLLLLFSTHNADKDSDQSAFAQRLAMMTLMAQDLSDQLAKSEGHGDVAHGLSSVPIDVGLTKSPFYNDKSTAINETDPKAYPSNPIHVHIVGYDNIIRICAPRYYPNHNPPLSALAPFFEAGHRFLVKLRPYVQSDKSSEKFGTLEEQRAYLEGLEKGSLEADGLKKEWVKQIDVMESSKNQTQGVSSSRIREAVAAKNWQEVETLCTPSVATWLAQTNDGNS